MSKMNELSTVLDELIECGEKLIKTATAIKAFYSNTAENEEQENLTEENLDNQYSFTDIRGYLADLAHKGYRIEVKELIEGFGVKNIKELEESMYPELMKKARSICNE